MKGSFFTSISQGLTRFLTFFKLRYLGLGALWAVSYCTWFSPSFFPNIEGVGVQADMTYLTKVLTSGIVFFILPFVLKKIPNISYGKACIAAAVFMSGGTALMFFSAFFDNDVFGVAVALKHLGAVLSGIGFSVIWVGWGDFFSTLDTESIELVIPFSFVSTPIALLILQELSGAYARLIFVCLLPIIAVASLLQSYRKEPQRSSTNIKNKTDAKRPFWTSFIKIGLSALVIHAVVALIWAAVSSDFFSSFGTWFIFPMFLGTLLATITSLLAVSYARSLNIITFTRWCLAILVVALVLVAFPSQSSRDIARILLIAMQLQFNISYLVYFSKIAHEGFASSALCIGFGRGFAQIGIVVGNVLGLSFSTVIGFDVHENIAYLMLILIGISVLIVTLLTNSGNIFSTEPIDAGEGDGMTERSPTFLHTSVAGRSSTAVFDLSELVDSQNLRILLTPREQEILSLVLQGRNVPYIRESLHISKNTVDTHMKNIYRKLNVHSRQELIDLVEKSKVNHTKDPLL